MKGFLVGFLTLLMIPGAVCFAQDAETEIQAWPRAFPSVRDFTGGGARAAGMGNAFIGVADDVSAVSWNPAGLYRHNNPFEQPVISLGYASFKGDSKAEVTGVGDLRSFDANETFSGFDFISFLAPVRIKGHPFVLSGSYTRLDDEYSTDGVFYDTTRYYTQDDVEDDLLHPYSLGNSTLYYSGANALNLGFGTRLYDNLSFGVAVNIYGGQSQYVVAVTEVEDGTVTEESLGQPVKVEEYRRVIDSTKYSGVYFTFGLNYATDRLSAGLIVKTPHILEQMIDRKDSLLEYTNGTAPDGLTRHFDDNLVELDMPFTVGFGLGFKVTENLLLAADIEYRAFSSGEVNVRDSLEIVSGDNDIEYFSNYDPEWDDVFAFRIGSEYLLETGKSLLPVVPLRAGFSYTPIPTSAVLMGVQSESSAKTNFSLGTGVRWDQIHLDFAYVNSSLTRDYDRTYRIGMPTYDPETGELTRPLRETSNSVDNSDHSFKVTFTGFF